LNDAFDACVAAESLTRPEGLLRGARDNELYAVVPRSLANLVGDFVGTDSWGEVYRNNAYIVFLRSDQ
jgi:hypothetical protein